MKVYGMKRIARRSWPTEARQPRVVVAAKSKAEAARILKVTPYAFSQMASVTGNEDEVKAAMSRPGVPFVQQAEGGPGRRIYTALEEL